MRQPKLRTGRDGVADPNACPAGYDPVRYCDVQLRKPVGWDSRFWVCSKCGHRGMRASEKGGTAGLAPPSPEAEEFLRQAQGNPAFNAMIERLADE